MNHTSVLVASDCLNDLLLWKSVVVAADPACVVNLANCYRRDLASFLVENSEILSPGSGVEIYSARVTCVAFTGERLFLCLSHSAAAGWPARADAVARQLDQSSTIHAQDEAAVVLG